MQKVIATGCFDVIHSGHIKLFEFASSFGDLTVGMNSDRSVRLLKGNLRPINKEIDRMVVLSSIRFIKTVKIINDTSMVDFIMSEKADFWVKGGDYSMETLNPQEICAAKKVGTKILFCPHNGQSTTSIVSKFKS